MRTRHVVLVTYGEPQLANGRDRREWARDLRVAVKDLRQP